MRILTLRVLEREPRFMRQPGYVRAGLRISPLLREEMSARGLTAKELAVAMGQWALGDPANRKALDYRTLQHAMEGSCELDSYLMLAGFFGWDFTEAVHTPVIGADPTTAREAQLAQQLAAVGALNARLERDRAARAALRSGMGDLASASALRSVPARGGSRTFDRRSAQPD